MTPSVADRMAAAAAQSDCGDNLFAAVLQAQAALLLVIDAEGQPVLTNHACESLSGYRLADLQRGTGWPLLFGELDREAVHRGVAAVRVGEVAQFRVESPCACRDGSERVISWAFTPLRDEGGRARRVVGVGMDVSAARHAQGRLAQHAEAFCRLQRWLTAGEVAAHIAHEVNQPLAAITAYSEATRHLLDAGAPRERLAANLEKIAMQALRAGDIIKVLRGPLSLGEASPQQVSLIDPADDARLLVEAYARSAGVAIVIVVDVDPTLPPVAAPAGYVEYVLVNLMRNAVEAIQAAGGEAGHLRVEARLSEGMARISVHDSGPGVDPQQVTQLFAAFQTTRAEGLGMGLRCCRRIVESLGGQLWVEPGQPGGTFHFTLPFAP